MINKRQYKLCVLMLKYIPIISAFLMILHIIVLLFGFTLCISELIILTLVSLMILVWSHSLKFCTIHKFFIVYTLIILWFIYLHRFIGLGEYLEILRIGMLYLGVILFIGLIIHYRIEYDKTFKKLFEEDN